MLKPPAGAIPNNGTVDPIIPNKRTPEENLAAFQDNHTFKRNCKRCYGRGHTGKFITGVNKDKYIACRCAKVKMVTFEPVVKASGSVVMPASGAVSGRAVLNQSNIKEVEKNEQ